MSEEVRHLQDYETEPGYRATVVASQRITSEASEAEVRELTLAVDAPDLDLQVGQSIGVTAPGAQEVGQHSHFRLYSVAELPEPGASGRPRIKICVRRCSYIDEYSGEEYKGLASNYLCDRRPGDDISISGPYGLAFEVPDEPNANLILIGSGTGIAPFRAFVKHLYRDVEGWNGRVWLFYGARSGLELLYMNDEKDDFAQYYDEETFEAFQALSARPGWTDAIAWDGAIRERGDELWEMLGDAKTYVYVAGLEKTLAELDRVLADLAGSAAKWERRKAELKAGRRWRELVY